MIRLEPRTPRQPGKLQKLSKNECGFTLLGKTVNRRGCDFYAFVFNQVQRVHRPLTEIGASRKRPAWLNPAEYAALAAFAPAGSAPGAAFRFRGGCVKREQNRVPGCFRRAEDYRRERSLPRAGSTSAAEAGAGRQIKPQGSSRASPATCANSQRPVRPAGSWATVQVRGRPWGPPELSRAYWFSLRSSSIELCLPFWMCVD